MPLGTSHAHPPHQAASKPQFKSVSHTLQLPLWPGRACLLGSPNSQLDSSSQSHSVPHLPSAWGGPSSTSMPEKPQLPFPSSMSSQHSQVQRFPPSSWKGLCQGLWGFSSICQLIRRRLRTGTGVLPFANNLVWKFKDQVKLLTDLVISDQRTYCWKIRCVCS